MSADLQRRLQFLENWHASHAEHANEVLEMAQARSESDAFIIRLRAEAFLAAEMIESVRMARKALE